APAPAAGPATGKRHGKKHRHRHRGGRKNKRDIDYDLLTRVIQDALDARGFNEFEARDVGDKVDARGFAEDYELDSRYFDDDLEARFDLAALGTKAVKGLFHLASHNVDIPQIPTQTSSYNSPRDLIDDESGFEARSFEDFDLDARDFDEEILNRDFDDDLDARNVFDDMELNVRYLEIEELD
ncbi:hypothetical protein H0H92_004615, partial [Tricholoma furcatifolium]